MLKPFFPSISFLLFVLLVVASCKSSEPEPVKSSQKEISSLSLDGVTAVTVLFDVASNTYIITVPAGTDVKALQLKFTLPQGATSKPLSGAVHDFTNPVTYTVTAEDRSTKTFTVKVVLQDAPKSSEKQITSFALEGFNPIIKGSIDQSKRTITAIVPSDASLTAIIPTILVSPKAVVSPASGVAQDYTNPVKYTVTAEDGSTQVYEIKIEKAPKSKDKQILAFSFKGLTPEVKASINQSNRLIAATLPAYANLTALVPTIEVSAKATVSPASGVAQNFLNTVNYTVTAEDGSTQVYEVKVSRAPAVTLADVVDDPALVEYLHGTWGIYVDGEEQKFDNYSYKFDRSSKVMRYENYYNDFYYSSYPERSSIDYTIKIENNIIFRTALLNGTYEKYARIEKVSNDEMKLFWIWETENSYREIYIGVLTKTSNVEKAASDVIKDNQLLNVLKGVWKQDKYSIYDNITFDFSSGKNYYQYGYEFQGAKTIDKMEYKVDESGVFNYRRWNSSFDPSWKKYHVEIISESEIKLYKIVDGKRRSTPDYHLRR
ncbi:DUF5018 domain-containing protein [Telluribacter sp. SYSU D00476]|uniref:DUF5018 domain-containing protein n=1 Tax=Telluribacter sp. SYSU D00476 TaxID=2811430 RepID=UPI001FF5A10A|nr:DUF5018 domain-containing protein [Telluribacter sp. SYSU D00476]